MRANTSTIGLLLTTVSVIGLGANTQAWAQDATPLETIEVVPGDDVATDEEAPGALAETPIAGDVDLSITDIETWQPQDLKQLFMTTPSVTVAGGSAASQKFYVHGIDQSKLNVQIDGVRQKNNVWHHNGNIGLDPMFLKQVSVDAGVAAADRGPGALGGAVRFETVDARDLLEPGQTAGGMARLGYDTNSRSFKGTGAGYGLSEGFEVFAALSREEGDDYETGDGLTETGTAADMWNGLGKLAYQSAEGHRIAFSGEYFRDYGLRRLRPNMGFVTADLNENTYERLTTSLTYTIDGATGMWDPEIQVYYNVNRLKRPDKTGYLRPSGDFNSDVDSIGGKIENTFHLAMGDVTAGIDVYNDKSEVERFHFPNDVSEDVANVGGYVQARFQPIDRFDVSTGLRADYQRYRAVDHQTFNNFGLSPNINLGYTLIDGLTARAGYSYVFGGIEQAEVGLFHAGDYAYAFDLDPTYAHNAKAGLEYANNGLTLSAGVFYLKMINPVGYDFFTRTRINGDDLVSKGVDLAAGYETENAFVRAAYSYTDIQYGDRIALASDYNNGLSVGGILTLAAGYTFAQSGVTVGADAEIAFDYSNDDLALNGYENPLPGYQIVNAFVEWQPAALPTNLTLRAEVNNLFGEYYFTRATFPPTARVTPVYSPGRSVYLSAAVKF